jgi:hypothetical protein
VKNLDVSAGGGINDGQLAVARNKPRYSEAAPTVTERCRHPQAQEGFAESQKSMRLTPDEWKGAPGLELGLGGASRLGLCLRRRATRHVRWERRAGKPGRHIEGSRSGADMCQCHHHLPDPSTRLHLGPGRGAVKTLWVRP